MSSRAALSRIQSPLAPSAATDVVRLSDKDVTTWKTSTQSFTSTTTLANVTDLLFALEANTKYAFDGFIIYDGSTASDIKVAFTVPSGATVNYSAFAPATGVSPTSMNAFGANASDGPLGIATNGANNLMGMNPKGYVATSATTGNLQFRGAQQASSATASRIWVGSWLRLTKLG